MCVLYICNEDNTAFWKSEVKIQALVLTATEGEKVVQK